MQNRGVYTQGDVYGTARGGVQADKCTMSTGPFKVGLSGGQEVESYRGSLYCILKIFANVQRRAKDNLSKQGQNSKWLESYDIMIIRTTHFCDQHG